MHAACLEASKKTLKISRFTNHIFNVINPIVPIGTGKKSTTIVIGLKKGGKNEETMQENYSLYSYSPVFGKPG
jgi:hypothetical protein